MRLSCLTLVVTIRQAVGASSDREQVQGRQSASITIDANQKYQRIDGFGFSEAFGFVNGLYDLPAAQQNQGLSLLFNTTSGAGLTIVRNRIPSGSDSIEPNSPGSPNAAPNYVSIGTDDNQIWFSKKALQYGVTNFYADAWSAPGYMKTNGNEAGGGYLCGVTGESCSSGDWRKAYANYLVQYIKDYQANGINISYVGFLNEPEFAATYSAMLSNGTQAASFIPTLHFALASAGLSNVGIACCDAEGWNDQKTFTSQLIAAGAESQLALITSHAYTSQPNGPINTTLPVWQTEYADLNGAGVTAWYANGGAGEGLTWANNIYQGIVESNLSAYLYWIGIQSGNTDASLIGISNNNTIVPTGRLWAFGQWSRFVRPGAVRLGTSGGESVMLASAFKNKDGSVAVVVINNSDGAVPVDLVVEGGMEPKSVSAWVSDNGNSLNKASASVSQGRVQGEAPARSMSTFVLKT